MTTDVLTPNNDWDFLRKVYAPECTPYEFTIFRHLSETYNLDPISKEIWCIKDAKHPNTPARIFVSRDGHLAIAHRSGFWGGMNTVFDFGKEPQYAEIVDKWTKKVTGRVLIPFSATTTIYRKDSAEPTVHTVFWDEYGSNMSLWLTKPKTMLQKVAECQCLRRAFDMHGFYAPEEFPDYPSEPAVTFPAKQTVKETVTTGDPAPKTVSTPEKKEVKQTSLPPDEEEIDWSATRKTAPTANDYDERQKEIVVGNYKDYNLDMAVFEKAKIGKTGFYDRDLINADYKKQLKAKGLL